MNRASLSVAGVFALAICLALWVAPPDGVPADPEGAAFTRQLDARFRDGERRRAARREVAREVAAGKMTFAEGTAEFLAMMFAVPGDLEVIRGRFPGVTNEELAARQLVEHVLDCELLGRRAVVTARLEADFAAWFGRPLAA